LFIDPKIYEFVKRRIHHTKDLGKRSLFRFYSPFETGFTLNFPGLSGLEIAETNPVTFDQYIIRYPESRICLKGGAILLFFSE